ncbi:hypothetical protein QYE76_058608 [Lolium multiflorum]|uniref:F-box domain-containing protein n=1 Tax=Lolium multiflorum TaxID=4521 RepID=A0AAD8WPU1_LOLMU|nr:hypothetical protein QYE76_058608 [Lolium multiflorum]
MSVGDGIRRPSWSDLPDDNLADVYHRLSSAPDRARFACVCTSWRRIAPPPLVPVLLPWTTQGSDRKGYRRRRALDLESGMPTRIQLPWFARGKVLVGSYSRGWVAAVSKHNQLMIINLSSGAQLPLSNKQRIIGCTCMAAARSAWTREVQKIIFSDYPDSRSGEGCILAAITVHLKLAVCRVSSPDNGWLTQGCGTDDDKLFMDIAFCKGELYGLAHHQVYKFQIGARKDSPHVVTTAAVIPIESSPYVHKLGVAYHIRYIFELHGKLTMALQADYEKVHRCEARYFVVLMLDATPCGGYMWTEVTTLGDNALFLSPTFSQAMEVPPEGLRSEVERNHIYYFIQHE